MDARPPTSAGLQMAVALLLPLLQQQQVLLLPRLPRLSKAWWEICRV
jgi:hypothetical protein